MNHIPPAQLLTAPNQELTGNDEFIARHLGIDEAAQREMLAAIGCNSIAELIDQTVPQDIRLRAPLALPAACPEAEALARLRALFAQNRDKHPLIGQGYYGTHLPPVLLRNVFENPGWYTAYTPYQAEVSQGRLEVLLHFQHMVADLTGLPVANASLLDEATAAAEAMSMCRRASKSASNRFFVDSAVFVQTLDVLQTRAPFLGIELIVAPAHDAAQHDVFGALLQSPNRHGEFVDHSATIAALHEKGALAAVACDLMALVLCKTPGEMGADIALGSAQRFGIPMGFGGPHAAFFAARKEYVRALPGRIIGRSRDAHGNPALRMALQTREQHIRREKANSNICTSQVLLANLSALYALWHGPQGLSRIAARIHRLTTLAARAFASIGLVPVHSAVFDTLVLPTGLRTASFHEAAHRAGFQLGRPDDAHLSVSFDEVTGFDDLARLLAAFGYTGTLDALDASPLLPSPLLRQAPLLAHPAFHRYHTEHQMLRYLKRLQNRDLALDHSMIPLGSCTMKLNAAAEMLPLSWPEVHRAHPFAPREDVAGTLAFLDSLRTQLRAITGFDAISLQPNSGAQGEYAGMVTIARYHAARGQSQRNVCLIPKSAHGTNPASAHMCGMTIVTVDCDAHGNVNLQDLKDKAREHADQLAALMITYPSTHGVFEAEIREICDVIHRHGGQVYMDGANLNAQVGLTSPAHIGADVSHMNLHKTFAIPHGGGGPGMGPIGVAAHLAPYLPDHAVFPTGEADRANRGQHAVSAAPFGSASVMVISWMYITLMGGEGLRRATETAILNANYLAARLAPHYPILYTGQTGRVAHECIIDLRPLKAASGITETDVAKRLMDYGFHAPTVSFPVAGTLMIEPTESEDKAELDRFVAAMVAIREEIRAVEEGRLPRDDNPLKHAPHTQHHVTASDWPHAYSREAAAYPLAWLRENKFWPSVGRIDEVYGDRNLACTWSDD